MESITKEEVKVEVRSRYDELDEVDLDYLFGGPEIPEEILKEYYEQLSKEALDERCNKQNCVDDYAFDYEYRHQVEEDELYRTYWWSLNKSTQSLTDLVTQ